MALLSHDQLRNSAPLSTIVRATTKAPLRTDVRLARVAPFQEAVWEEPESAQFGTFSDSRQASGFDWGGKKLVADRRVALEGKPGALERFMRALLQSPVAADGFA